MKEAVLFDLGNTLVHYYERPEFPPILREAVARVSSWLAGLKKLDPDDPGLRERAEAENYEADDHRVRPLEERLANIFRIDLKDRDLVIEACRHFMEPIFDRARIYDETLGVLAELGRRGYRTAIVSNTPWGSPALLWQEELLRLGLIGEVDEIFFCRDAGWRKPSPILFSYVIEQMMITPRGAIFVGDDHRRDCVGAAGIGIDSILVDRTGSSSIPGQHTIGTLTDLLTILR